jgi:hypothetical protein
MPHMRARKQGVNRLSKLTQIPQSAIGQARAAIRMDARLKELGEQNALPILALDKALHEMATRQRRYGSFWGLCVLTGS